jgi:hypothetical protein
MKSMQWSLEFWHHFRVSRIQEKHGKSFSNWSVAGPFQCWNAGPKSNVSNACKVTLVTIYCIWHYLLNVQRFLRSRNCLVGTVNKTHPGPPMNCGSIPGLARDFMSSKSPRPATGPTFSLGVKQPPPGVEVKNEWNCTYFPTCTRQCFLQFVIRDVSFNRGLFDVQRMLQRYLQGEGKNSLVPGQTVFKSFAFLSFLDQEYLWHFKRHFEKLWVFEEVVCSQS